MKKGMLIILSMLMFLLSAGGMFAAGVGEEVSPVIASTSWTAAFIRAAGYEGDLYVLAPYEVRHPSDYELKVSDIAAVSEADFIVYAGYERMVDRIREATENKDARMIQITTNYTLPVLKQSITAVADALGTGGGGAETIQELDRFYADWKSEIAGFGAAGAEVICHFFQRPLAEELGFTVIGVFGPAPIEASELNRLSEMKPDFLIDNWHNDVGAPLREIMPEIPAAVFINFPGHEGTETLLDVLRYNREKLGEILE